MILSPFLSEYLNSSPSTGISPISGTLLIESLLLSLIRPPIITVSPLLTIAVVLTSLFVVLGIPAVLFGIKSSSLVSMFRVTLLSVDSLGFTFRVKPISCLVYEFLVRSVVLEPTVVCETIDSVLPTYIEDSWLLMQRMDGSDNTFAAPSVWSSDRLAPRANPCFNTGISKLISPSSLSLSVMLLPPIFAARL